VKFNEVAFRRYTEAYQAPRLMLSTGKGVKGIGVGFSLLVFLVGICNSYRGMDTFVFFIISLFLGLLTFGLGMIISNQGQILQYSLDTAVNTSPFLTERERADVMLSPRRSWDSIGIGSLPPINSTEPVAEKNVDYQYANRQIESPVTALIAEAQAIEAVRLPRSGRRPSRFASRRWY
jgi:hypothetical protein